VSRLVFVGIIGLAALLAVAAQAQTPERAVVAGTLIEDRDGDGTLNAADGGAQTLVVLMQRSLDGGYKCVSQQTSDTEGKFRFEDLSIADYELYVYWDPGFLDVVASRGTPVATGTAADLKDGLETVFVRLKRLPEGMARYGPSTPGFGVATACEGLDNPAKPQNICAKTGPMTIVGPREFSGGIDAPAFTLPAGTFRVWYVQPPSAPAVVVCYVEGNSSITFSLPSVSETGREVHDAGAGGVLDAIAVTARFLDEDGEDSAPIATASPAPTATPGRGGVRPPDTGDGGLR
jgi:hypothetical protein